ncbi:MAG: hypothetical protein LC777_10150 [Actinobacteria bacterium]|nr:hypothetical protein [Actinomycetota bacterium]
MEDSSKGAVMGTQIKPLWDPTGTVSVEVDQDRRELVVRAGAQLIEFALGEERPERLGWVERRAEDGRVRSRHVSVGEVVCHCLREWEAEQQVLELSRRAARWARARGGPWVGPGRRLGDQATSTPRRQRVSTLPFQVLFAQRLSGQGGPRLTATLAAQRMGYEAGGRCDTQRLLRRIGLASHSDGHGRTWRQRSVGYDTGVALCRAVEVDPVELGL